MQLLGVEHIATQDFGHRLKQRCNFAYPASKNRTIQLDAFPCKDLRLAIQRRVVAKLRRDYVRQQAWPSKSAIEHSLRRRSLYHAGTLPAAHLRTHMTDDVEAPRHVLQHLRGVFVQLAQLTATAGALGKGRL